MEKCSIRLVKVWQLLFLTYAFGSPVNSRSVAQDVLDFTLQIPMNNKNMCGGDMAGGMIGPDCKPPKVRLHLLSWDDYI
jgi:hypothetical protein